MTTFHKQLKEMIEKDSQILIEYWLEFFDPSEKDEQYRYYDDFLGFFEECVEEGLDPLSDSALALKHFLKKIAEIMGQETFFNFRNSVYSCFLKFPILRRMDEIQIFHYPNVQELTSFFEALTSHIIMETFSELKKSQKQSEAELEQREASLSEIWDGVVMVSIVGTLDSDRVLKIIEKVLEYIELREIEYVIIDISAIYDMNSEVANQLIKLNNAIHFMGATPLMAGITRNIAKSLTHLNLSLGDVRTFSTTKQAFKNVIGYLTNE